MKLLRYGRPVSTIFDLLGTKEDDMTYTLGYVASRSPKLAKGLIRALGGDLPKGDGIVRLQDMDGDGRTDVELEVGDELRIVIEAKRGAELPSLAQLRRYAGRFKGAGFNCLVAVTNAPPAFARTSLPQTIDGIPVAHLSWRQIRDLVRDARPDETNQNKIMLGEFGAYLTEILGMEISRSNMVYVVSLGEGGVWGLDFKDVVNRRRQYFYTTKGGWPPPPNYLAVRFDGRLQSIYHVEGADVFSNPRDIFPDAESREIEPHYLLRLGPPIVPPHEVKNGPKISRAMRVWCMLDTLLTCSTITGAWAETKRRLGEGEDVAQDG
jgi:hypothetical protein